MGSEGLGSVVGGLTKVTSVRIMPENAWWLRQRRTTRRILVFIKNRLLFAKAVYYLHRQSSPQQRYFTICRAEICTSSYLKSHRQQESSFSERHEESSEVNRYCRMGHYNPMNNNQSRKKSKHIKKEKKK